MSFEEKRVKILIISSTITHHNSVGKITTELATYLENNGNDIRLIYLDSIPTENKDYIPASTQTNMKIYYQLTFRSNYQYSFQPVVVNKIRKYIREFKPDVIQLIQPILAYINNKALFKLIGKYKVPCVYTMIDEYAYLGGCDNAYECEEFYSGCNKCTGKNELINKEDYKGFWNKYACRKAAEIKQNAYGYVEDICFVAPEWVVRRAANSFLLKGKKTFIVDEYVNNSLIFYPRNLSNCSKELSEIDKKKIIILNVARYTNVRKGIKYFIELAKKMEEDNRFLFINIGYDGKTAPLPTNYKAIPFVKDQDELAKYYTISDLYMITSLSDTMPNVCLESLSCGTPVCGFNVTGIPYVAEEPLGTFVTAKDVNALMNVVLKTNKKDDILSKQCRDYALSRYSPNVYGKKMMEIYEKMKKQ